MLDDRVVGLLLQPFAVQLGGLLALA